jgi:hypothetical protein
VYLWPTGRRGKAPLKLRLIVLKQRGKEVHLLTNVLEPQRLSRAMASDFYRGRWGVEVNYRGFKQTMARFKVLAKSPECGGLELAGNIVAMGLLRLHAAMVMGADTDSKLSSRAVRHVLGLRPAQKSVMLVSDKEVQHARDLSSGSG